MKNEMNTEPTKDLRLMALRIQLHQIEMTMIYGGPSEICGALDEMDSAVAYLRETVCSDMKVRAGAPQADGLG